MTPSRTRDDYDIRAADPGDPSITPLAAYAFTDTPSKPAAGEDAERDRRRVRQDDRIFISYLDDEPIAKTHTLPMTMNVRGIVMPMGGVSGVACMPVGRRGCG